MAAKQDTAQTWNITVYDTRGTFHVHHDGDRASARRRALRLAEITWPKEDGYRYTGTGEKSDCITAFKGTQRVGDVEIGPLKHPAE